MQQAYEAALRAAADLYAAGDLGGAKDALERLVSALPAPGHGPPAEHARLYLGWVRRCLRISASAATPTQAQAQVQVRPRPATATPAPSEISLLDLDEDPGEGPREADLHEEEPPAAVVLEEDLLDLSALLAAEGEVGEEAAERLIEVQPAGRSPLAGRPPEAGARQSGRIPPTESNLSLLLSDLPLVESSAPPPSPPFMQTQARALDPDQTPVQAPALIQAQAQVQASSGLSALLSDTPLAEKGRSDLSVLLSDRPAVPAAASSSLSGLLSDTPATATAVGGISTRTAPPRGDGPEVPQGPSVLVADDLILAEDLDDDPVILDETEVEAAGPPLDLPPAAILSAPESEARVEPAPPNPVAPMALEILHPLDEVPGRTGTTPDDLAVEFEDIVATDSVHLSALSTGSPMSFPPPPPRSSVDAVLDEAQRAISRGDRQGGLQLLEQVLHDEAGGDPGAPALRPYQARLAGLYESLLGPLDRLARAGRLPRDLEPSSAFLLSLLDGSMTLEEALMVSGLDRLRGARTLALLIGRGLVKIG